MQRSFLIPLLGLAGLACPPPMTLATKDVKTQFIVASQGGTITVTDADYPPLAGTSVSIPPNSLAKDTTIVIDIGVDGTPAGGTKAGPAVRFGPDGTQFSIPARVTLLYALPAGTTEDELKVEAVEADGTSSSIGASGLMVATSTLSFQTSSFTAFNPFTSANSSCMPPTVSVSTSVNGSQFSGPAPVGSEIELLANTPIYPDGGFPASVSCRWTLVSEPALSRAELTEAGSTPELQCDVGFECDLAGTYEVSLLVADPTGCDASPVTVTVVCTAAVDEGGVPDGGCGFDPTCPMNDAGQLIDNANCAIACPDGLICSLDGVCVPPQYSVSSSGIVTDEVTGLDWQQQIPATQCSSAEDGSCTWAEAQAYCETLNLAEYDGGWSVPTAEQLFSLVERHADGGSPSLDSTVFLDDPPGIWCWSSTAVASDADEAWAVNYFFDGALYYLDTSESHVVRCVRAAGPMDGGSSSDVGSGDAGSCIGLPGLVALTSSQQNPAGIGADSKNVYWTDRNNPGGTLMSVPICGGTPQTLLSNLALPGDMVVDSENVYWEGVANGTVVQVPTAGGAPITLATDQAKPYGITVDSKRVYWTNGVSGGTVVSAPIGGGLLVTIAQNQASPTNIAVDANNAYWTNYDDGTVMAAPLAGGGPIQLASGQNLPYGIWADGNNVYWTEMGAVVQISATGGTPVTLAAQQGSPAFVVADATTVYWSDSARGNVLSAPIGGGSITTLATGQAAPNNLAITDSNIYWCNQTSPDGAIMSAAKH